MIDTAPYLKHSNNIDRIIYARLRDFSKSELAIFDYAIYLDPNKIYTVAVVKKSLLTLGEAWYVLDLDRYDDLKFLAKGNEIKVGSAKILNYSDTLPYSDTIVKGSLWSVPYFDDAKGILEEVPNSIAFIIED